MTAERMLEVLQHGDPTLKVFVSRDSIYRIVDPVDEPDEELAPCIALIEMVVPRKRLKKCTSKEENVKIVAVIVGNQNDSQNCLKTEDVIHYLSVIKDEKKIVYILDYLDIHKGEMYEVERILTKIMD